MVVVGAVLVALLIATGLWSLRPGADEAADGSRRGTTTTLPTTTTSPPTTIQTEIDGVQIVPPGSPSAMAEIFEVTGLPAVPIEITAGGGGFVALGQADGTAVGPVLYGSPTGQSWVRFARGLGPDVLSDPTVTRDVSFFYAGLAVVDSGLVVSVVERFTDRESGETTNLRIKRLTTLEDTTWRLDPGFHVIEIDAVAALPLFNGPDLTGVAVLPEGRGNPLITRVLNEWVADPEIANGCFVNAFQRLGIDGSEPGFRLQTCDQRSVIDVEPEQLVVPGSAEELLLCLQELSTRSAPLTDIFMQRRGGGSVETFAETGTTASVPVAVMGGERAAVLSPSSSVAAAPGCDRFAGFAAEDDSTMALLDFAPGAETTRIESDGLVANRRVFEDRIPIAADNENVVVPLLGTVYSVDLTSGEWIEQARAVRTTDRIIVAPNGRQIFTFRGTSMYYANIGEPWKQLGLERALRRPLVLFADDERVFFNDGLDTLLVELPTE